MKTMASPNRQIVFNFVVLVPIFFIFSLLLSRWYDAHKMDFGAYWQAGHMILSRQNVYDSAQWNAVRQIERTAFQSGETFQYPLPLAMLFSGLALLSLEHAYILWMFLAQIAVLSSIMILLSLYPARSGYLELLAIAGIFLFRPLFSLINSGQILSFLLLALVISIRLFHDAKWLAAGFALSVLSLKPSVGFPIILLTGIWLVFRKQWRGIWGMILGGFLLVLLGAFVNYHWVIDYVNISENSFQRVFGMQPTLWGVVDKIFEKDSVSLVIGLLCSVAILAIEIYLLWRNRSEPFSLNVFASIVSTTLLIAPYLWNYDQVLLAIPMIALLINISMRYGIGKAAVFMFGIVVLAFAMVAVAYQVRHDVWSVMNTFVVWLFSLYFLVRGHPMSLKRDYAMPMPPLER